MRTTTRVLLRLAICLPAIGVFLRPAPVGAGTVLEAGGPALWRYLDDGSGPEAEWRQPGFDDSKWRTGQAPLGYGEPRLRTLVRFGNDAAHKHITTWFRCRFDAPGGNSAEQLVLLLCVDDGAVIYLNGQEIDRVNMPGGRIGPRTLAVQTIDPSNEGVYVRRRLPPGSVRPGASNLLAVEVHQAGGTSSDLFLDLAIKATPETEPAPEIPITAWEITRRYHEKHYVGPGATIPDGYLDGGRFMRIDADRHARSDREILRVDRRRDGALTGDLAFARSPALRSLPQLERVRRIAARIDERTTPPGGPSTVEKNAAQLEREFRNQSILIGDWNDQGQSGVCRHRSLLFKILADEAGLDASLVRGNYAVPGSPPLPHAWNEVVLDDGRRVLVDVSLEGSQPQFLEVTTPEVTRLYLKVDNSPWYGARTD